MTSLVIPSSVTEIDSYVFEDCLNLEDVTFPEGIQRIETGIQKKMYFCTRL